LLFVSFPVPKKESQIAFSSCFSAAFAVAMRLLVLFDLAQIALSFLG
jgi:hypothetical protein